MWPVEAGELFTAGKSLTELDGIGPSIARRLAAWLEGSPEVPKPPPIRREFQTRAQARKILARHPDWSKQLKGDLQMHSEWSDGASPIAEMAEGGIARNYQYVAITDHTKGLKIAGGLDEKRLASQAARLLNSTNG